MNPRNLRGLFPLLLAGILAFPVPGEPQPPKKFLPDFETKTLDGVRLTSQELRGKVVLLDFWATWCVPCVESIPSLRQLSQQLESEPFVLVSISADAAARTVRKFVKENQMTWPQVWDKGSLLGQKMKVRSFPTHIVVGGDGEILFMTRGWGPGSDKILGDEISRALRYLKRSPAATNTAVP